MKFSRSLLVALIALAVLAPAAGAADVAGPRISTPQSGPEAEFALKGTNGFRVQFGVSEGSVGAQASKGTTAVTYLAHGGAADSDHFSGTLPGIGSISVRFHQRGKTRRVVTLCPKAPTFVRQGFFVGTIRLRGEQGYTRVRATRAQGAVSETPGSNCGRKHKRRQTALMRAMKTKKPQALSIEAQAGDVTFASGQITVGEKLELSVLGASHIRRHDGMVVESATIKFGSLPAILPTDDAEFPQGATVQPPAPFSGSATFELVDPHSSSWTGDLAVELPGLGKVRIAGPSFRSRLCVGKHCEGSLPPEEPL